MDADWYDSRTVSPDVYNLHQSGNDPVPVHHINLWNKYRIKLIRGKQIIAIHLSILIGCCPGGDRVVHSSHPNTTIGTFPRGGVAQAVDCGSCEDDILH